ncbi:MAG TPA: DUF2905 domain-containing protein [Pseudogracilibacillus sp.]|nr:DUF2905 domain-containing protein [Pseudogracilibacillus sp.]
MPIGKILMLAGLGLLLIGALLTFVGKLPGDISFKKGSFSFHFPIMTSIIASIILSLLFYLFSRFR